MEGSRLKRFPYGCGCGQSNPIGLRLQIRHTEDGVTAEFTPTKEHQGWPGTVNGGVISALLYEIMENLPYHQGVLTMSRNMETRYRRPAQLEEPIEVRSWLASRSDRAFEVQAELRNPSNEVIAEGSASLVILDEEKLEQFGVAAGHTD